MKGGLTKIPVFIASLVLSGFIRNAYGWIIGTISFLILVIPLIFIDDFIVWVTQLRLTNEGWDIYSSWWDE